MLSVQRAFSSRWRKTHAPKVIALELAIRFLTDHLLGGVYFRSDYEGHNLARARNQLTLLRSM
jgi:hypothetical protein